jgi:Flp pilus assembly protein TadD
MFKNKKVIVVMPAYNAAQTLKITYDEVMEQGIVFMKQEIFEEAIDQYRGLLEKNPRDAKALNNLGVALACVGRHEEAISRFREALKIDLDHRKARDNLEKAMQEMKTSVMH